MSDCPKCGNADRPVWDGPRYAFHMDIVPGFADAEIEHLVYTCKVCGFTREELCKDAA